MNNDTEDKYYGTAALLSLLGMVMMNWLNLNVVCVFFFFLFLIFAKLKIDQFVENNGGIS